MWANYLTGGGKTIAVLDTGVDRLHPFLGGRVVEEACFSSGSNCPNGQTTQTGTGSAAPCIYSARLCLHGTHVAGIAAGQGSDFSGVAPNANIMAVQVFHRATGTDCTAGSDPCPKASTRDLIKALERVYQLRNTYDFAAVNMSLGSDQFTDYCDAEGTDFLATKAIIDNLKAASTATVLSSGNEGSTDAVGFPGCISSAITVGNTTKQDTVAIQSNMAPMVDLLAPGTNIVSSVPGGGFASESGTSMAAPHVAGAFALLDEKDPGRGVTGNLFDLQFNGTPVADTRPGGTVTGYRINIADAARVRPPGDSFGSPQSLSGASINANGINGAATRENGEPDHLPANGSSLGENSVWYSWTAPSSGQVEMNTCQTNIDSILAVYTGSDIGALSRVADDRNSCPDVYGSKVSFNATAGTTYRIAVADTGAENSEDTFTLKVGDRTSPIDTTSPGVTGTSPANNATGVLRGANLTATFSEAMQASTINTTTFRLRKSGTTTNVAAALSYDPATKRATLNPNANLQAGATYVATVTTGAKDLAGNAARPEPEHLGQPGQELAVQGEALDGPA